MIKAIFFDVDGTLLSHTTKQVPQDTKQTLIQLQNSGIKIFMSTGRHPLELSQLPVNDIEFDGYITLNGQLCLNSKKKVLLGRPFDQDASKKLVSIFKQKICPIALVESDRIYINFVNNTVLAAQKSISTPVPEIGQYNNSLIYQATAFTSKYTENFLINALPHGYKFTRWNEYGGDIISNDGGKSKGVNYFCDRFNLRQNEIVAFGDSENDIDMLQYAEIGIAMGNADSCVKKIADYVTTDVDQGGIINALEHFSIINKTN